MKPAPVPFDDQTFSAPDGLRLNARIYTPLKKSHDDVICLPGLTRNGRDFHDLALHLAQAADRPKRVIVLDSRGRGLSEYDKDWQNYNVITEAGDVLAMLAALGIETADFIGTSRGGILIHLLAAMEPTVLKRIVLNDIGPVIEGEGLMRIKAALERAPKPKDWDDAVKIQRDLHGHEFPALTLRDWDIHARAVYREFKPGKISADFDPKLLKTLESFDPSVPIPDLWTQFGGLAGKPLMVIRGENSKLLSAATVAEMQMLHPKMAQIIVGGQGHAPMLWTSGLPEGIAAFIR
jgi:pimeloyl-ACP methyl ester carboxylesterase